MTVLEFFAVVLWTSLYSVCFVRVTIPDHSHLALNVTSYSVCGCGVYVGTGAPTALSPGPACHSYPNWDYSIMGCETCPAMPADADTMMQCQGTAPVSMQSTCVRPPSLSLLLCESI